MYLLFVRHARPVRHVPEDDVADPPLHAEGRLQAKFLSARLAGEDPVDAVYASPALRARQTANPIGSALGLHPRSTEGLAEYDAEATAYYPVEELRHADQPRWDRLAAGLLSEPAVDPVVFRQRVVDAVEEIVTAHPGGRAVLVCHAGVINAYIGHVLGVVTPLWFAPNYASVSMVGASRTGKRGVVTLNDTCHLRPHR